MSYPPPSDLLEESGPVYRPTLASYIGDNEAIFISQLDFILRNRSANIKWADGKAWYKQKPLGFAANEFPAWGEAKVKRTINNLKNDGLIRARSDLNDDKTRSLWYTVDYHAVNNLTGPVYRLLSKAEKLTAASHSRVSIDSNEYTKSEDQNDTLIPELTNGIKPNLEPMIPKDQNDILLKDHFEPTLEESFKKKESFKNNNNNAPMHEENLDPKWAQWAEIHEEHFGTFSSVMVDEMHEYCDKSKIEWFQEACKRCYANGVRKWSYCKPILESFIQAGKIAEKPNGGQKNGQHYNKPCEPSPGTGYELSERGVFDPFASAAT